MADNRIFLASRQGCQDQEVLELVPLLGGTAGLVLGCSEHCAGHSAGRGREWMEDWLWLQSCHHLDRSDYLRGVAVDETHKERYNWWPTFANEMNWAWNNLESWNTYLHERANWPSWSLHTSTFVTRGESSPDHIFHALCLHEVSVPTGYQCVYCWFILQIRNEKECKSE